MKNIKAQHIFGTPRHDSLDNMGNKHQSKSMAHFKSLQILESAELIGLNCKI